MAIYDTNVRTSLLSGFPTIRVAVPSFRLYMPGLRSEPKRPAVSQPEAQALLRQMLIARNRETSLTSRERADLQTSLRIRQALYS